MHKVSFIGGGNMAAAIIGGLIASGADPVDIEVVEINADARANLAARFGVVTHAGLSEARLNSLIVLAVKPQSLPEVAAALSTRMAGQLVLSIAAGVRVADLARWLGGHARIVRAMP
ncbi:MAG: NAD(P)-binding domain-containing protein, partial [Thiobacillus sp.]|nr:NAD(P)-binding domain-containing protein [Thiobacillus sp.]